MEEKVRVQYIAVKKYHNGEPVFGKIVSASDRVSAMTQFDLMDEPYVNVVPYVDSDKLYLFDDD